ncbi:molybdopterin-dependent oxidoreductase [Stackebrandtia nassauensis]|uniref:Oxidoreductase molybdopterin binding protein n=1 Tax=Stackebrandtia nassauensis (strain DSM 44728 / CIP 108903 / NRRL B-16338 / NBRC 102104 / LLR-40K-21) TaxID=446470 RepID=D3Q9H8_STANL|nr:molybdopterin-dependent oxidoreductase [Stackebrandtia nassauensis]ADD42660.1 oxidoreductase molybdopterin binding protein [Stackebrandtia nassauensis DSM 44728]
MADMVSSKRVARAATVVRRHRLSPFRDGAFSTFLHNPRTATVLGRLIAACFALCLLTGLYSHFLQEPLGWMTFPVRPVWLYRLSQGLHVATGTALIPLLLAKLWTVYPRLFTWPVVRSPLHALERLSIAVLVATSLLQLFLGFANTVKWYPWSFSFRTVHFWLSLVILGSLLIHIAVKLPLLRGNWRKPKDPEPTPASGWSRRGFFATVAAATVAVTVTTVGQSFTPLGGLALLAPRKPGVGPQGLPVNRTAAQANVTETATDAGYRLTVRGPRTYSLSLDELNALPQHEVELPIACVEGWSQNARWGGVRLRDLLKRAGAPPDADVEVASLETDGHYRTSRMGPEFAQDAATLLALRLDGETLHIDHGYPARLIAPARPGVLQTKWVATIEVLS